MSTREPANRSSFSIAILAAFWCLWVVGVARAETAAAPTSAVTEKILVEQIAAEHARAVALLEGAVNINSGTMNFSGVKAVADLFIPEFRALGFSTHWVDGAPFGRAGHLLAEREGHKGRGPKILLIGHLDTVFPIDSPLQKFEIVDEHFARGPGTTDMKGGDAVMIQALRALAAANVLDDLSIRVILTGDEEKSGDPKVLRAAVLTEGGRWADYALGFEDGDGSPATAVVARRGSSGWTLTVEGTRAHSSQIFQPQFGAGAVFEAARILQEFRLKLSTLKNLTFNPGTIVGGTEVEFDLATNSGKAFGKNNVIASNLSVSGDLRATSLEQLENARQLMRKIVSANLPGTTASIEFHRGYPPMAASDGNYGLLAMLNSVSEDLGFGQVVAVNPRNAGAADISFVANDVEMALDGLGLMGAGGHTLEEVADLRTLDMQAQRVAVLLYRLSIM